MANTTTISGRNITIVTDGTTDWHLGATGDASGSTTEAENFADAGLRVKSITFDPSGADTLVIRDKPPGVTSVANGIVKMKVSCVDTNDQKIQYFGDRGQTMWPCIDQTDCTFSSAASATIMFELA